jgi:hypothetical protein
MKYLILSALMLPLLAVQADAAKHKARVTNEKQKHPMCKVQPDPRLTGSWHDHYGCWRK